MAQVYVTTASDSHCRDHRWQVTLYVPRRHVTRFLYYAMDYINNTLAKPASGRRRAQNERSALFKLPIEILNIILELIPGPCARRWRNFYPFWRTSLTNSFMLIPVTHTCFRLREVALAHPHLWTTFRTSSDNLLLIRRTASWRKQIPLNIVGSDVGILDKLRPNTRFGSVYFYDIRADDYDFLRTLINRSSFPVLHSFSLFFSDMPRRWDPQHKLLPISPESAPNLRELTLDQVRVLPYTGFPTLTHLALVGGSDHMFRARLADFIKQCPQLESIALGRFGEILDREDPEIPNDPPPIPLPHLRHVTLREFPPSALRYYLALLQPRTPGSSVQVLGYLVNDDRAFPPRFLLQPDSNDRPTQIGIEMNHTGLGSIDDAIALTVVSAHCTRRVAALKYHLDANCIPLSAWPSMVLSQPSPSTSPWDMEEVWLYGLHLSSSRSHPWKFPCNSPLQHFPNAKSLVLVVNRQSERDDVLSLSFLPSSYTRFPGGRPAGFTSLRVVYAFRDHDWFCDCRLCPDEVERRACQAEKHRVPLNYLIGDFKWGGYEYLKHFVLQVMAPMYVDEKELDDLRDVGRFETFRFERIEAFPDRPGHSDPARRGCARYSGSVW
ncbi:hypothetical protein LXA43DRAFT_131952 [Ganoderma leucocontextum]|nr:hypothetical protein LXA43DRAFT_131952 [Ganoderma leucocontextum]